MRFGGTLVGKGVVGSENGSAVCEFANSPTYCTTHIAAKQKKFSSDLNTDVLGRKEL